MAPRRDFIFSSESVAAGHPDKICDQISDSILDAIIANDESPLDTRGAIEALATTQHVTIAGEFRDCQPRGSLDFESIVRHVLRELGYTNPSFSFDVDNCEVVNKVHRQSVQIAEMVDTGGAGDQGLMFGYANRDTKALMPLPIHGAHRLIERIDQLRESGTIGALRPDGKCQLSVRYVDGHPVAVTRAVLAVPHAEDISKGDLREQLWYEAVTPIISALNIPCEFDLGDSNGKYILNGNQGDWNVGGPHSDTGLTGRKIIVDTYGGWGRHGGGCFSGKDPTKVDRSAAYMLRYVAKNVVAAGLADECEIQAAYAIGWAKPMSFKVHTGGTGVLPDEELERLLHELFDFRPTSIITALDLFRPIYRRTASYGHFGRELTEFTWERTNRVEELAAEAGKA